MLGTGGPVSSSLSPTKKTEDKMTWGRFMLPWGELTDTRSTAADRHIMERMGLDKMPDEYTLGDEWDEIADEYDDMRMDYSSGSKIDVARTYQRRGIATALRDLLSEINDRYLDVDFVDDRPDPLQTPDAQHLWAANQNDPNYRDRLHEIAWRSLRERMGMLNDGVRVGVVDPQNR